MHNKLFFGQNPITLIRRKRFYRWALYIFSFFFGLVVCYEPQTWGLVEKMYIIYFMHIDFIQSSSFNHWIKLNFDSKWTLNSKILSCMPSRFQFIVYLSYLFYITFLGENGSHVMCFHLKCHLLTINTFHNHKLHTWMHNFMQQ
jgi:hypothetical protein